MSIFWEANQGQLQALVDNGLATHTEREALAQMKSSRYQLINVPLGVI